MKNTTHKYLKKNNFIASKKMGQNFLIDQEKIKQIIENIPDILEYDLIIEIGPGLGSITDHLVQLKKKIIAIELDKRLYSFLKNKYIDQKNLILVNDDFLDFKFSDYVKENQKIIVIANIPYSIASKIVMKCIQEKAIEALYIMVQKEFADRFDESKNSNKNAFTIFVNHYYNFSYCFSIPGKCFEPAPKVESSMIIFNRKGNKDFDNSYLKFLRNIFLMKRKTLLNNIISRDEKIFFENILKQKNISQKVRAEELDHLMLHDIYSLYVKEKEKKLWKLMQK